MVSREAIKVFALFLVWCSMGLYLEIPGPTMIDIKLTFKASYEEVSRSMSGRGAGGLTGALIGGYLVDRFSHSLDMLIGLTEAVAAVAVVTAPFTPSVDTLWFHYFTLGICAAVISMAGIRSAITLLPEKTAVTLQVLHVGYGVGALLVPLIVNPFLAAIELTGEDPVNTDLKPETFKVLKESQVQTPFVAIGMSTLALSIVFCRYHFQQNTGKGYLKVETNSEKAEHKKVSFKEMINPRTYASGQAVFGAAVLLLLFAYFFIMVGGEEMYGNFVRSFSVEVFKFSKTKASYLNLTFWLGLTVGRLVGSFISNYISIGRFFIIQVLLHSLSTTVLYMYAATSPSMLWFCTVTEGFLVSPLYPCGIAFGTTLIEITGISLMVINLAGSFGDLSFIWVTGKMYDSYGPQSVLLGLQVSGIALLFVAFVLRFMRRFKQENVTEIQIKDKS